MVSGIDPASILVMMNSGPGRAVFFFFEKEMDSLASTEPTGITTSSSANFRYCSAAISLANVFSRRLPCGPATAGRVAVLAYHSGEDRIVKNLFRDAAGEAPRPRPDLPPPPGHEPSVRLLWRGARRPSEAEVARNPRAEAARFRAVEKLEVAA